MKQALLFLFLAIAASAGAQDIVGNAIVLGHTDSIQSKILNEKRTVWVHSPAGAGNPNNGVIVMSLQMIKMTIILK